MPNPPKEPPLTPTQFTRRLYRLFKEKPFIFELKKLKGARGYCFDDLSKIEIDYREEVISTLVHEALHYIKPDWKEKRVRFNEIYLMQRFSKTQIKNILKRFSKIL